MSAVSGVGEAAAVERRAGQVLFHASEVSKAFGETQALAGVDLEIRAGEVHALVGENGSGKSTLVKILSGVLSPDAGEVRLEGAPMSFRNPAQAQRAGVSTVFQETLIIEELSVWENAVLGLDGAFRREIADRKARSRVGSILELFDSSLPIDEPIWRLGLAERQLVTIARALLRPWRLLILDEATSALDVRIRDRLFEGLDRTRRADQSVLFISHRMDEIRQIADRLTVLRSGRAIETLDGSAAPADLVLRLAAGGEAAHPQAAAPAADRAAGGPVLRVGGLRIDPDASPIDLELGRGEILGLAGLEGHGQTRFLETLAGRAKAAEGSVEVAVDGSWMLPGDPRTAADRGVAYVPRERKREGILPTRSVTENMTVSALPELTTAGVVRPGPVKRLVAEMIERLRIKTQSPSSLITSLSGGNQQKVILGRALSLRPHILLLNDPLRGVDHGAKLEIHAVFRELSAQGTTLVILSTEIEELLLLCGRIAVFREGSVEAILEAQQTDQGAVVAAMFGSRAEEGDRG